jgi:hypothetical protein
MKERRVGLKKERILKSFLARGLFFLSFFFFGE